MYVWCFKKKKIVFLRVKEEGEEGWAIFEFFQQQQKNGERKTPSSFHNLFFFPCFPLPVKKKWEKQNKHRNEGIKMGKLK